MKRKAIVVDTIIQNGKPVNIYLCDRKLPCNNSPFCGKECKRTFHKKHAKKGKVKKCY